jgi:hypothetical protein
MYGPNKLEHLTTLGWESFTLTNTLAYWPIPKLQRKWSVVNTGHYSQYFIFFIIFIWVLYARVLGYTRLERLYNDKHSSLFGLFLN